MPWVLPTGPRMKVSHQILRLAVYLMVVFPKANFDIKIPTNLGTRCDTAGKCAIQWWWYAYNKQTYESCVDFIIA